MKINEKTKRLQNLIDEFLRIHSIDEAFTIRSFELVLLIIIDSAAYFYLPDWNILFILTGGILITTFISFSLSMFLTRTDRRQFSANEKHLKNTN